jgi:DNA-binding CsgD family transcriptional regulator/uncharacterized protein YkwD
MADSTTGGAGASLPAVKGARKPLTSRQAQVLELVAEGLSDKEIAARLELSLATVRSHLQRMYRERGFRNRADAAATWVADWRQPIAASAIAERVRGDAQAKEAKPFSTDRRAKALVFALPIALLLAGVLLWPQLLVVTGWHELASQASAGSGRPAAAASATSAAASNTLPTGSATARPTQTAPVPPPSIPPVPRIQVQSATAQLGLVNQDRATAQTAVPTLSPVGWSTCLASVAAEVAQALAARGYVGATQGVAQDLACGLGAAPAENAAYWSSINDAQLNSVFMNDPVDRSRILGGYHYIGAAWARGPNGMAFLVVEFS